MPTSLLAWAARKRTPARFWLDCLFFIGGLAFWLFFFSQFILPVRRLDERGNVFMRLLRYLTREHGPAIFIESGEIITHGAELKQRGDGVAWLDAASGAIISNDVSFTRGWGRVSFTRLKRMLWWDLEFEHVASAIDLHHRFVKVGPQPDEDPFADPKNMPEDEYHHLQEKRWQTSGLTRDGIEIVPTITVFFKVGSLPERSNPRFRFDRDAVFNAWRRRGHQPTNRRNRKWAVRGLAPAARLVSRRYLAGDFGPLYAGGFVP